MKEHNSDLTKLLSHLDWFVFILVLVFTVLAVFYGQYLKTKIVTKKNSLLDYLIMGRQLTLPLFVATLVATWYGGIFGVTQIAFTNGIYNLITQGVFWYVSYIIFAIYLVPKITKYQAVTLPSLIGKMFGPRSAKLAAVFNLINILPVAYTISLGILLNMLFGWDLIVGMVVGLLFVTGYSMFGGLRSVVFSDLIQFFVMCSSVLIVLIFSIFQFGGIEFLTEHLPKNHFSPTGGNSAFTLLVWGFIALSTLVDPNFYQRCFAAKTDRVARTGILISTVIWFGFDICTTFGAMYARATMPDADPSNAYMLYSLNLLPEGLRGFFLAGVVATILSTIDSYLFVAGTTIFYDLSSEKNRKSNQILKYIGITACGVFTILLADTFEGNIRSVWKTLGSYSASCLLFPVMCGYIFPGKFSDRQFVWASLAGVVSVTLWKLVERFGIWREIDELYIGILVTAGSLLLSSKMKSLARI